MNIADGEIGITTDFESVVLGSSPSPRTSASDLALYGEKSVGVASPSTQKHLIVPGPCRHCHGPSWLADDIGTVHPCCELNGPGECRSCKASESLNREHRRRKPREWKEVKGEGVD